MSGLEFQVCDSEAAIAVAAADEVAATIREALVGRDKATVMFATGVSQIAFLAELVQRSGVSWSRVNMCHLDEYVGISSDHPASFVRYVRERATDRVAFRSCTMIDGMAPDPAVECARLNRIMRQRPIDLALVGIGENGHLAFNDPPADFEVTDPFIVVDLDDDCRRQQVGEGWFPDADSVPRRAISASIRSILSATRISCVVPGRRKAEAVRRCFAGQISPLAPASALRLHGNTVVWLDRDSVALLDGGRGREPC